MPSGDDETSLTVILWFYMKQRNFVSSLPIMLNLNVLFSQHKSELHQSYVEKLSSERKCFKIDAVWLPSFSTEWQSRRMCCIDWEVLSWETDKGIIKMPVSGELCNCLQLD